MSRVFSSAQGDTLRARIKAMAVRLKAENPAIKHSHALHVISKALGFRGWNVLSALINTDPERIEALLKERFSA